MQKAARKKTVEMKPSGPEGAFVPHRFEGQVALVTGGAQGIGKAIAVRLAREGAHVVISDIDRRVMKKTVAEIAAEGGTAEGFFCDVRKQREVERLVSGIIRRHRRIDILMAIAGVAKAVPFLKTDEKLWDWTVDTNLKGAFFVARAVAPHMVEQGFGRMVFMASTNSWDAEAEMAPYNVSKSGVFLLAKTLARELGRYGIRSNALGPGFILTRLSRDILKHPAFAEKYKNLIPVGRFGEPQDVAGPASFLASRDSDYINGVLLFVDGGQLA
jgi:3-oxoacyl-[acyl-carrier protein] reductase